MTGATSRKVGSIGREERAAAFVQLGKVFVLFGSGAAWPGYSCGLNKEEYEAFDEVVRSAHYRNGWFTEDNVRHMLKGLSVMLDADRLRDWLNRYPVSNGSSPSATEQPTRLRSEASAGEATNNQKHAPRTIGLILAGNVPLVGFHDLLCVLISGHRAHVKCSSDDAGLTPAVLTLLGCISPDLAARAVVSKGKLGDVDAVIATGSNNTARYFDHYFGHLPHIVRKSRTSVAVLDGSETEAELVALGEDLFRYFGLGCRNVSKLFVPRDFDLDRLFNAIFPWQHLAQHNKWANNYDYHKAIWLMDRVPLIENGFVLFKEDPALHSPLGSLYFAWYDDRSAVEVELMKQVDHIQCIIGHGHLPFGSAQSPGPQDYADGVDTMRFLSNLGQG